MWTPKDIISLSISLEDAKNDQKAKDLRESVNKNGWLDCDPEGIHLFRLPEGKYLVASGGNHRTYLSNEIGIEKILVDVDVLILSDLILDLTKKKVDRLRDEKYKLHDQMQKFRHKTFMSDEDVTEFNSLSEKVDSQEDKINELYKEETQRLGYITTNN